MNSEISQAIKDSADITMITQVVLRERESRDLGNWDEMRNCFHQDSIIRISWFNGNGPEFVDASIDMARRGMKAKHRLSPVLVKLAGDRAIATLSGIIDIPVEIKNVELTLSAYTLFIYRVEKRDDVWRIYGFDAIYRRDELTPSIPGQTVAIDPDAMSSFRPSYRNLCYALTLTGYEPNLDLPGEDRPETVEKLMNEINSWAGL